MLEQDSYSRLIQELIRKDYAATILRISGVLISNMPKMTVSTFNTWMLQFFSVSVWTVRFECICKPSVLYTCVRGTLTYCFYSCSVSVSYIKDISLDFFYYLQLSLESGSSCPLTQQLLFVCYVS